MVSGHLSVKKGYYYCVLSWTDEDRKRHTKWVATGLPMQNNKRKAEAKLLEIRTEFVPPQTEKLLEENDPYFSDFLLKTWLPHKKTKVQATTYSNYEQRVNGVIAPYFEKKKLRISQLTVRDIQNYYEIEAKSKKGSTVIQYHAIIHNALEYAVRLEYIPYNIADRCEKPKKEQVIISPYTKEELDELLSHVDDDAFGLLIKITACYGFRRSEVVGLKWSAVNLKEGTITACHAVTQARIDGKMEMFRKDEMKNRSSYRTLPLVDSIAEDLKKLKQKQDEYQDLCGDCYYEGDAKYIFVDEMGHLIQPDYVTDHFQILLRKYHLRRIRFHDLRHSCATLLVRHGVPMKQVQEWLGHSDFGTTANMYTHLAFDSKEDTAKVITRELNLDRTEDPELDHPAGKEKNGNGLERTQERTV